MSEALFLPSMLLEAKLTKKVNVIAHTDSTRGTEVPICAEFGANGFAANGKD